MIAEPTLASGQPPYDARLISLNIWGGHVKQPLLKFMQDHQAVDIFCLQEVYDCAQNKISTDSKSVDLNIFSELSDRLPDHEKFFSAVVDGAYGIGMFIRKSIKIIDKGVEVIHENPSYQGQGPTHGRILQWALCESTYRRFYVINVHGLWNGKGKTDSPERIKQSHNIRNFVNSLGEPVVLCGDFNLLPDTHSMAILDSGMENLIKRNKVTSTRTSYYPKDIRLADYIIVSPEIHSHDFKVLPDEVSDHAPLYIEFGVNKTAIAC